MKPDDDWVKLLDDLVRELNFWESFSTGMDTVTGSARRVYQWSGCSGLCELPLITFLSLRVMEKHVGIGISNHVEMHLLLHNERLVAMLCIVAVVAVIERERERERYREREI